MLIAFLLSWALIVYLIRDLEIKSAGLCCDPTGGIATVALLSAASGGLTAYSQYQAGSAQNKMYQAQADAAQQQGQLALTYGQKNSELVQDTAKLQGKQLATNQAEFNASQRASAAASGVSGASLEDVSNDTFNKQRMDELGLKYNADLKSWQITEDAKNQNWTAQNEANQLRAAGKNAKIAGRNQAFATLLGTAASIGMGMWQPGSSALATKTASFGGGVKPYTAPKF